MLKNINGIELITISVGGSKYLYLLAHNTDNQENYRYE